MSNFDQQSDFNQKLNELFEQFGITNNDTRNQISEVLDAMIVQEKTGERLKEIPKNAVGFDDNVLKITALMRSSSRSITQAQEQAKEIISAYKGLMDEQKELESLRGSLFDNNDTIKDDASSFEEDNPLKQNTTDKKSKSFFPSWRGGEDTSTSSKQQSTMDKEMKNEAKNWNKHKP